VCSLKVAILHVVYTVCLHTPLLLAWTQASLASLAIFVNWRSESKLSVRTDIHDINNERMWLPCSHKVNITLGKFYLKCTAHKKRIDVVVSIIICMYNLATSSYSHSFEWSDGLKVTEYTRDNVNKQFVGGSCGKITLAFYSDSRRTSKSGKKIAYRQVGNKIKIHRNTSKQVSWLLRRIYNKVVTANEMHSGPN